MAKLAGQQAAIIIFGAAVRRDGSPSHALRRRVAAAARHGEALDPPALYLPTGAQGRFGPPEAAVMAALLGARGVPPERVLEEATGRDTLSSVLACAALLRRRGHGGPVLAASDGYHLPRCRLLLRMAGVKAAGVVPEGSAARDWRRRWFWRLREVPALPWDVMLMLWSRLTRRMAP